ncbi:hypothetical protein BD770DRAFT_384837 [Pilaira anomala]|nr:hypothetical protein BD770DRAFT_384837 [Pilaira anomala]
MNNNNNNNKSPFDILGVNRFSTQKEIRRRYLDLCKKHHPDVSTNKSIDFTEITVAYESLTNSKKNNHINQQGVNWEQVRKSSINTRTWTRNSYIFGFGLTLFTIIYLSPDQKKPSSVLLPHERNHLMKEKHSSNDSTAAANTTLTPWQAAGMTFREWRKK